MTSVLVFRVSTNWRSVSTPHLKVGWARSHRWNANLTLEKRTMEIHFTAAPIRASFNCRYSRQVDLGDRVRDLMGLRIADGTTDVMRMEVVRSFYGSDFWTIAIRNYEASKPPSSDQDETSAEQTKTK